MQKSIFCLSLFILLLAGEDLISAKLLPFLNNYSLYFGFVLVLYAIFAYLVVKFVLLKLYGHRVTLRLINFRVIRTDLVLFLVVGLIGIILTIIAFAQPHRPNFNLLVVINALTAGIFEEALFRGGLLYLLLKALSHYKNPPLWAALISSLIFGFAHLENLFFTSQTLTATGQQAFTAAILGLIFAIIYLRTGSLIYPMILHFLNDAVSFLNTNNLDNTSTGWGVVIVGVAALLVLLIGVYLSTTNRKNNSVLLLQDIQPKNLIEL